MSCKLDISLVNHREAQQNKMDNNVAVPLICNFLVNCDNEIERLFRNENDFDFVAIARGVLLLRSQKPNANSKLF